MTHILNTPLLAWIQKSDLTLTIADKCIMWTEIIFFIILWLLGCRAFIAFQAIWIQRKYKKRMNQK